MLISDLFYFENCYMDHYKCCAPEKPSSCHTVEMLDNVLRLQDLQLMREGYIADLAYRSSFTIYAEFIQTRATLPSVGAIP